MKQTKWILFGLALVMIGVTTGYLAKVRRTQHLGAPGVRVGPVPLYGQHGTIIADHSVLLPETVLGVQSVPKPITDIELNGLPKDTTFGRRQYPVSKDFAPIIGVVLMGTDRTSIHQPQFCLVGQGWIINQTEHIPLQLDKPTPYELPAIKLTTSILGADAHGETTLIRGMYVYWFVTADKITADQGARLWSIAKSMLKTGELERWAYVSYFVTCPPGQEDATFERLENFIRSSVPTFQLVSGRPTAPVSQVASRE